MRETVFLNTDREMPLLGLGVYKTADNEAETAITAAVDAGYRLIDTASAYKNEESVDGVSVFNIRKLYWKTGNCV